MWYLLIIILNVNGMSGLNTMTVLKTYTTGLECQSECDRIGEEMAAAYPDDHDFVLACHASGKHES